MFRSSVCVFFWDVFKLCGCLVLKNYKRDETTENKITIVVRFADIGCPAQS
jgi:hypothetical protein